MTLSEGQPFSYQGGCQWAAKDISVAEEAIDFARFWENFIGPEDLSKRNNAHEFNVLIYDFLASIQLAWRKLAGKFPAARRERILF